jgi:O-antigen/teichoic acid export membrane protein
MIFNSFKLTSFIRNALTLTLGTFIAQGLPILFYPILSRVYSPKEFGVFAIVMAIAPFVTLFASGSYENAILITKNKREEANLIGFILLRSTIVVLVLLLLLYFIERPLLEWWNKQELQHLLYIPIIGALFTVIYNCFNEWCVKNKYFSTLAWNKIINTSSLSIGKLSFGLTPIMFNGLVIGDLIGKVISSSVAMYRAMTLGGKYFLAVKFKYFSSIRRRYIQFPRLMLPDQLLNNVGASMHVFFVAAYFGDTELGHLTMAMSLLYVPVTVISTAIKDVFRQKANEDFQTNGDIREFYLKLLKPIAAAAVFLAMPIYFILPDLFSFFLGKEWLPAGFYAQIMLPVFVTNFISMSLGGVFVIVNKMQISLYWQLYGIATSIISLLIGVYIFKTFEYTLICFAVARTSSYILYAVLSYYFAKSSTEETPS